MRSLLVLLPCLAACSLYTGRPQPSGSGSGSGSSEPVVVAGDKRVFVTSEMY